MKKASLLFCLLFFVNLTGFAQESGNRIYGNRGYYNQKTETTFNTGVLTGTVVNRYSIEASVLLNVKADTYVAVFGVAVDDKTAAASNEQVNARINEFIRSLRGLGVTSNDIFVDFITQNRVYDYSLQGGKAIETPSGFETKKTIAVRYKSRDLFEKILTAATGAQIFDLIKVDYIVADFDAIRNRLFEEAVKIVKGKEVRYKNLLGAQMTPAALANEKYKAFYPSERYQQYQAFETGDAYTSYESGGKVIQRKSFTFYYDPLDGSQFDSVLNPVGIEPIVQFTLYLRMDYDLPQNRAK